MGTTLLHFNGSIDKIINTGDLILLDPDVITIGGKSSIAMGGGTTMTPLERWHVYKLAGRRPYADTLKAMLELGYPSQQCGTNTDCNDHITGHRVIRIRNSHTLAYFQVMVMSSTVVSIPIGFGPSDPGFGFEVSGVHQAAGHWEIHSKAWTTQYLRVI